MTWFVGGRLAVLALGGVLPLLLLRPAGLAGQEPSPTSVDSAAVTAAAATITGGALQRTLAVLAGDSLRPRPVGSPALARAAAYVGRAFAQLGLAPAPFRRAPGGVSDTGGASAGLRGDSAWLQRYSWYRVRRPVYEGTSLAFTLRPRSGRHDVLTESGAPIQGGAEVHFIDFARFGADTLPIAVDGETSGHLVLVAGRQTPATVRAAQLRDDVVLYVPAADADAATRQAVLAALNATSHVVVLSDEDSVTFAARRAAEQAHPPVLVDPTLAAYRTSHRYWRAMVWAPALHALLRPAGVDLERVRTDTQPILQRVPALHVSLQLASEELSAQGPDGFNVVGVLPGVDSSLSGDGLTPVWVEALFVTAAIDGPDSVANASGVAGLLALAKALSQPGARPRRSIVFVATTGGEVGERSFVKAYLGWSAAVLWSVTLDDLAGPRAEAVRVEGLKDYVFTRPPQWEALRRTGLSLIDGGSSLTADSNHVAFLEARIASWRVSASAATTESTERPTPNAAEAEPEVELIARRARFVYYVVQAIANAPGWPQWTLQAAQARRLLLNGH